MARTEAQRHGGMEVWRYEKTDFSRPGTESSMDVERPEEIIHLHDPNPLCLRASVRALIILLIAGALFFANSSSSHVTFAKIFFLAG